MADLVSTILTEIARNPEEPCFGIRITEEPIHPDDCFDVPPSRVWYDNEPTDEHLTGVSTIGIREAGFEINARAVREALAQAGVPAFRRKGAGDYDGDYLYLLAGENAGAGEDLGEQLLSSARVLAVFHKTTLRRLG